MSEVSTSSATVAIVDDDGPVRLALLRLLRSEGLSGRAYGSATEFLSDLELSHPACVVLDVHMPDIGGLDLQQRLAREWPRLPVIMMTGQHSPENELKVRSLHPADFLLKPIDGDALIRAIRAAIG